MMPRVMLSFNVGSASRSRNAPLPPASAQGGTNTSSPVKLAVYGY